MNIPKELPILFNGLSVRSIIRHHKTETRRAIKPQPTEHFEKPVWSYAPDPKAGHSGVGWYCGEDKYQEEGSIYYGDPYGPPGTILWVRESAIVLEVDNWRRPRQLKIKYMADEAVGVVEYPERLRGHPEVGKYLAYGCYKEAARIRVKVTKKWPEQLHDIDHKGVTAEGYPTPYYEEGGSISFQMGWDKINGKTFPYEGNPWVWAVRFEIDGIAILPKG